MSRSPSGSLGVGIGIIAAVAMLFVFCVAPPGWSQTPAAKPAAKPATAPAAPPAGYAGAEVCKGCHEDQFEVFSHTKMGRLFLKQPRNMKESLGCENCHGPGKAHADAGGGRGVGGIIGFSNDSAVPIKQRNAVCLGCHQKGARLFWNGSQHESADIACTSCHVVMRNVSLRSQLAKETEIDTCGTCHIQRRAQQMRSSHMPLREGKMKCTSCHNPHGTVTPSLLKENSVNDTCYTCHTDKRGPFLWDHAPVTESCVNCHDPHGSNHERMLKVAKPRLCQQCHDSSRHPTNTYGPGAASFKYVLGRSCNNCHVTIHGSNHPSGFAFER